MPCQSVIYTSYPNIRTRAFGTLNSSRVRGHGVETFFAVYVFSRSSVRPWTNIILGFRKRLVSKMGLRGVFGQICNIAKSL